MVKHTQTIRRQQSTNCLGVFDHLVGLALKRLKVIIHEKVHKMQIFTPQKHKNKNDYTMKILWLFWNNNTLI